MPQISLNSITAIKLCPINRLWLIDDIPPVGWDITSPPTGVVSCNALQVNFSEQESQLTIDPVTTRTGKGGNRMVAARCSGTLVFPHTDIEMMDNRLKLFIGKPVSVVLQLGDERYPEAAGYTNYFLYLTKIGDYDARCEVNYSHETVDQRIRTKVSFNSCIMSPRNHFTENVTWWWS